MKSLVGRGPRAATKKQRAPVVRAVPRECRGGALLRHRGLRNTWHSNAIRVLPSRGPPTARLSRGPDPSEKRAVASCFSNKRETFSSDTPTAWNPRPRVAADFHRPVPVEPLIAYSSAKLRFTLRWTAADATGHWSQSSTVN